MRIDALMATGGKTYAQMPRFASEDGKGTNIEAAAAACPDGRPMNNPARNVWVTATALTTALNTSYMAEQISLFGIAVGGSFLLVGLVLGCSRSAASASRSSSRRAGASRRPRCRAVASAGARTRGRVARRLGEPRRASAARRATRAPTIRSWYPRATPVGRVRHRSRFTADRRDAHRPHRTRRGVAMQNASKASGCSVRWRSRPRPSSSRSASPRSSRASTARSTVADALHAGSDRRRAVHDAGGDRRRGRAGAA